MIDFRPRWLTCLLLLFCLIVHRHPALAAEPQGAWEPVDGDRVILLGSTLVERDAASGYLETLLTTRFADRNILFRNLGWSGDTVWADARAGFDTRVEGFQRMREQIRGLAPTWVFVAYGTNEAFAGPAGVATFVEGLNALLDMLTSETQAKLVLITPRAQENLGRPLPDPGFYNQQLGLYAAAIREVAAKRGCRVIDLYERLPVDRRPGPAQLTENGLHFSPWGYWRVAQVAGQALQVPTTSWAITLDAQLCPVKSQGTQAALVDDSAPDKGFVTLDQSLPTPLAPASTHELAERVIKIAGLAPGNYRLHIDGKPVITATAEVWAQGVALVSGPEFDQVERLRAAIRQKNEYYFHRWRPQNDTYLFGFRKHEQGQNAVEVPQFDPLVAEQEAIIAALRKPVPHRYVVTPE